MKNRGKIYMMMNIINGKIYIGQTIQDVDTRFKQHLLDAYNENKRAYNNCLSRGIRKYGKDAFKVATIANDVPEEALDLVEEHYIDMYGSNNNEIGYNVSPGHNDNSDYLKKREEAPDYDYSENEQVITDDIPDDEVNKWMKKISLK